MLALNIIMLELVLTVLLFPFSCHWRKVLECKTSLFWNRQPHVSPSNTDFAMQSHILCFWPWTPRIYVYTFFYILKSLDKYSRVKRIYRIVVDWVDSTLNRGIFCGLIQFCSAPVSFPFILQIPSLLDALFGQIGDIYADYLHNSWYIWPKAVLCPLLAFVKSSWLSEIEGTVRQVKMLRLTSCVSFYFYNPLLSK